MVVLKWVTTVPCPTPECKGEVCVGVTVWIELIVFVMSCLWDTKGKAPVS